jgi:D-alanyl-D-alanine-carboxypeptidase/D-alanyl-D-alanine-endopeptidase
VNRAIISIFLLTLVSSISIAFLLSSSPTLFPAAIASSFTTQKEPASSTSVKITDEIKDRLNALVDSNRTKAAIVIGIVDPNGTQFYNNGKISSTNNTNVDQNTIFAIGSNTKVFTTVLLAEMVEEGLIKLNDPIDKYLPPNVTIPQYK